MPIHCAVRALMVSAALVVSVSASAEPVYTVTWIPEELGVAAMNDAGHVIGNVFTPTGPRIASWSDKGLQILPDVASPFGLNNRDEFAAMKSDGPPERPFTAWAYIGRE